eukprot:2418339-Ditylum_brightwellii.AAC.2
MDCIGWQSEGRLWILWLCGGNREQDPMEGKQTIPRKSQSNGILTCRKLWGLAALCSMIRYIKYYNIKPRTDLILYF